MSNVNKSVRTGVGCGFRLNMFKKKKRSHDTDSLGVGSVLCFHLNLEAVNIIVALMVPL